MQKNTTLYFLFLFFLVSGFQEICAQDRSNYQLLWEIKHKDSSKKSYLFGTMHVKDARAFQFSDAVLPALERSEAFALEIHPDSINSGFGALMLKDSGKKDIYKEILSTEEYKKLADRFYEVNQSSIDSFSLSHPFMIESMLIKEPVKENDKRTFLDAYLYGVAYSLDKKIAGLEKIEDQIPAIESYTDEGIRNDILAILENSHEEQAEQLEYLTQLYIDGDIQKVLSYTVLSGGFDQELIDRNIVMTNSMINIMKNNSLFAAVGAAHLPGEKGIIDLLKKEGYEVNPLPATFNSEEKIYQIEPNLDKWNTNKHPEIGFEISTPSEATPVDFDKGAESYMSIDLLFGGTFVYFIVDLRSQNLKENYDFVANVISNQISSPNDSLISERRFVKNGIEMAEIYVRKKGSYTRMQLAFVNKILYSFFAESTLEDLKSSYSNGFFESANITSPKIPAATWHEKVDPIGAFKVDYPDQVTDMSRTIPNPSNTEGLPYILNIQQASDKKMETTYLTRFNDQPLGYYLNDEEAILQDLLGYFDKNGSILSGPDSVKIKGRDALEMEVQLSDAYRVKTRMFVRGNRTYLLLAQKPFEAKKFGEDDRFFDSFEMIPFEQKKFDSLVSIDGKASFLFPKKAKRTLQVYSDNEYSYEDNIEFAGLEDATGGCFMVQKTGLRAYNSADSLEEFYDTYQTSILEAEDTVEKSTPIKQSGYPGREIIISNSKTRIKQRFRMILVNNQMYLMNAYVAEDQLYSEQVTHFLNSLDIKKTGKNFNITSSKTKRILNDLKSKDSLTFQLAKGATSYYNFKKKDYKALYRSLEETFADDTTHYSAKYNILQQLILLDEPKTLDDLKRLYLREATSNKMRLAILEFILNVNNEETFAVYTDLLLYHAPERKKDQPFLIFSKLADSLDLVTEHEREFIQLAKVDNYRNDLVRIYRNNFQNDTTIIQKFKNFQNALLSHFDADARLYTDTITRKQHSHIDYSMMANYLIIISETKTINPTILSTLQHIAKNVEENNWLKTLTIITGISLNTIVDQKTYDNKLSDMYSRFEIMEAVYKHKSSSVIPKEYENGIEFGMLSVYNEVGRYSDQYPTSIELLGTLDYTSTSYNAYSYQLEEEGPKYLGVATNLAVNKDNFILNHTYLNDIELKGDWKTATIDILKEGLSTE